MTLYIRKIPDRLENKRLIRSCVTDLEKEGYEEFLEKNKVEKILRVYIKKMSEEYSSVIFVIEDTSQKVRVLTVNNDKYELPD